MNDAFPLDTVRATAAADQLQLLHVGCGPAHPDKVPDAVFPRSTWREIRLDIDLRVAPDIAASITDMPMVASGSMDGVWSAHNLEHLSLGEVPLALSEFFRVLRPGGFAAMTLPDLQQVAALIANGQLEDVAYNSALGPITALDMVYGFSKSISLGNHFMGHRTGFTATTLAGHLQRAGFVGVEVRRDGHYALWAKGVKPVPSAGKDPGPAAA